MYLGPNTPSGGGLRIMKNPDHDPETTPRTHYSKFAFDSESGDLGYAYGINANIAAMGYYPMVSVMNSYVSGWWELPGWVEDTLGNNKTAGTTGVGMVVHDGSGIRFETRAPYGGLSPNLTPLATRYLVWQLPATNIAAPFPPHTGKIPGLVGNGPAGQIRMPRAGRDFYDGNVNNFILHENLRPAKVVAAGRVSVGWNQTVTITLPTAVPDNVFIGGQFAEPGFAVVIPYSSPAGWGDLSERRCLVRVVANRYLEIREYAGFPIDVSYYVVAEDGSGHTVGSGPTFIEGVDAVTGQTWMQIRRPNASMSPNFADILLDSRWQVMPLVANGYVPKGNFAQDGLGRYAQVSIPALGFTPLVLTSWQVDRSGVGGGVLIERLFMDGAATYWLNQMGPEFNGHHGATCITVAQDGLLRFYNWFERPMSWVFLESPAPGLEVGWNPVWSVGTGRNLPHRTFWDDFAGVRFWVFAIPQG